MMKLVIVMVDSNIQRESLLPSEKAYAYKMKMDAVKHQGVKDENAASVDTADLVGRKPVTVEEQYRVIFA